MNLAYRKADDVFFKDETERPLNEGEIRVKVLSCGVCGTDLHVTPGEEAMEKRMTGHEVAGEVLELGQNVTGLKQGQPVVLDSSTACGRCSACRNTQQELCSNVQSFFPLNSFGFAQRMIAPAISAIPYDNITPDVACLQEPLGVAIDMTRLVDLEPGRSNVLVMGQGPIGLMVTALAKRAGARRIFTTEIADKPRRIALSREFGADVCFDPMETPVEEYEFGCKIDRILVTAPPKTLNSAFNVATKGAVISFIGIAYGDGAFVNFDANAFHFKKLQLRASFASPALYGPLALQYLSETIVDGEALISHRFQLTNLQEAINTARGPEALKVVVNP